MRLNARTADFVERVGAAMQSLNAARTAGRLLGVLLVSDRPVCLDDACRLLRASKGTVSTNARMLRAMGLIQRVRYPRDRRDYYEVAPGTFERILQRRADLVREWGRLAEAGLGALDTRNLPARERLQQMADLHAFLGDEMAALLDRWRLRRGLLPLADE